MWISHLPAGSGLSGSLAVCSGAVSAEEFGTVGDKWSGDTTCRIPILNMSFRSAYFIDKAFFWYNVDDVLKITFLKCQIFR
jgi:hypothetical protein